MKEQDSTSLAILVDRFMREIHGGLQVRASEFDKMAVGPGGGIVLLKLAEVSCIGLADLTKRVARDKSQMTRTMRSLEAKGLVKRQTSVTDARVSLVSLTKEGRAVVGELVQAVAHTINEILEPLSEQDKEDLSALLRKARYR